MEEQEVVVVSSGELTFTPEEVGSLAVAFSQVRGTYPTMKHVVELSIKCGKSVESTQSFSSQEISLLSQVLDSCKAFSVNDVQHIGSAVIKIREQMLRMKSALEQYQKGMDDGEEKETGSSTTPESAE